MFDKRITLDLKIIYHPVCSKDRPHILPIFKNYFSISHCFSWRNDYQYLPSDCRLFESKELLYSLMSCSLGVSNRVLNITESQNKMFSDRNCRSPSSTAVGRRRWVFQASLYLWKPGQISYVYAPWLPPLGKKKKDNNIYHIWFGEELNEVSGLVSSITSGIDLSRAMGPLFPIA